MLLVIDNHDSFTYNLVQGFAELGETVRVEANDAITVDDIARLGPTHLVVSPGPRAPDQAGVSLAVIERYAGRIPILGVCLGHQAVGQAFGGKVVRARQVMHGKTSMIFHGGAGLFAGLLSPFEATRYHSLVIDPASVPACLEITARTGDGEVMALGHRTLPVVGVQFHPESFLTVVGKDILRNFLSLGREGRP